jgi:hypothetical protein
VHVGAIRSNGRKKYENERIGLPCYSNDLIRRSSRGSLAPKSLATAAVPTSPLPVRPKQLRSQHHDSK